MSVNLPDPVVELAMEADAQGVATCVDAAYEHYIARIARRPRPMEEDYGRLVGEKRVHVLKSDGQVVGVLVLKRLTDEILIENVAIRPRYQGRGLGLLLLTYAENEARQAGLERMALYTHELMTENIALYTRFGYHETERELVGDAYRVHMKKGLGRDTVET